MSPPEIVFLASLVARADGARRIEVGAERLLLPELLGATSLGEDFERLEGRSLLLLASDPLRAAAALVELDGWARRIVLCPPDLEPRHLPAVVRDAGVEGIIHDGAGEIAAAGAGLALNVEVRLPPVPRARAVERTRATEWVLLTSGTSGDPKMVEHSLASLTGAVAPINLRAVTPHWATFYDIRRYGGLQIFLRALVGGGALTLRAPAETVEDFLERAGAGGVTHISGTPSHWRLVVMSKSARAIDPDYVRLSGEIADSALLSALRAIYPRARIAHAYASTEAGVGFEVEDGEAGFPVSFLGMRPSGVELKIVDGTLRMRSSRAASRYLGDSAPGLADAEGFVDTGDMIELRGERCYFVGRRGGIINVGGAKVNPEEVEAIINLDPRVRASLVKGRRNPITGALVAADVVLREGASPDEATRAEILAACASRLAPHKVPALLRFVPALEMTGGGKLARHG